MISLHAGLNLWAMLQKKPVKWLSHLKLSTHILEGVIAETKAPQRGNGSDENDKGSDSLNSTTALEVGTCSSK